MTRDPKKCRFDDVAKAMGEDRISNLPRHLITCILDCMAISDVARTSVLSKTWKDIWETHPHIDLGRSFFHHVISKKNIEAQQSQLLLAVNSIFLAHRGPILKFTLYMPPSLHLHESPYPHLWFKKLSEKGVQILNVDNSTGIPPTNIPSYFFSYSELRRVTLFNWKLKPPLKFGAFRNLATIYLIGVTFTAEISFGAQVKNFSLVFCIGIEHLNSQLTKHGKNINFFTVLRRVQREMRYAAALNHNPFTDIKKSFNMFRLLGNMHTIHALVLNATCLQYLDPGPTLHNQLSKTMENLDKIVLHEVAFNDMYVISNTFCLLRSTPNLEDLTITVGDDMESRSQTELTTEQYLESPDCANIIMNQLQTVEMREIMGSRAEILFIKFLLASSPSLRSMTLVRKSTMNDVTENYRILQELLQFPRKSPVQIYWR